MQGSRVQAGPVIGVQSAGRAGYWGAGQQRPRQGCLWGHRGKEGHPLFQNKAQAPTHTALCTPFISSREGQGGSPKLRSTPASPPDSIEPHGAGEGREMTSFVSFWGGLGFFFYRNTVRLCTEYLHPSPSLAYKSPVGKPKLLASRIAAPAGCQGRAGGIFLWPRSRRWDGGGRGATLGLLNPLPTALLTSPRAPCPPLKTPEGFKEPIFLLRVSRDAGSALPQAEFLGFVPQPEPRRAAEALA